MIFSLRPQPTHSIPLLDVDADMGRLSSRHATIPVTLATIGQ
jgi:hypothetical protein